MSKYRTCNRCGAHLDFGERCDCEPKILLEFFEVHPGARERYENGTPQYRRTYRHVCRYIQNCTPEQLICVVAYLNKANRPSGTNTETIQEKNAVNSAIIVAEPERNVKYE